MHIELGRGIRSIHFSAGAYRSGQFTRSGTSLKSSTLAGWKIWTVEGLMVGIYATLLLRTVTTIREVDLTNLSFQQVKYYLEIRARCSQITIASLGSVASRNQSSFYFFLKTYAPSARAQLIQNNRTTIFRMVGGQRF